MKEHIDIQSSLPDVIKLCCEPIENVRIAFIGLGKRGKESLKHYMYIDGVEIVALCDIDSDSLSEARQTLKAHNKKAAKEFTKIDDWQIICQIEEIDLIYVCTNWSLHTPIAVCAMQNGKHVAIEVPAANTIEECWQLVDTSEKYRRHCIMLENCCYDQFETTVLNMSQHGVLGEITHAESGYIHDLREVDFDKRPDYLKLWQMHGNPYPTHGIGPLCQLLNIHRGDKLSWLVSVSGGQFGFPKTTREMDLNDCILGNTNTTIIKTHKQKTIILQHDISSPRPYMRNYLISGTSGFINKHQDPKIFLSPDSTEFSLNNSTNELFEKYEHPFYKKSGKLAHKVGAHGGMDFIMDFRLIYCLQNGLPLDMDVYDAAEWSSIVELTAQSVKNGSKPVEIPDFTRGRWNKLSGLDFSEK